MAAVLVVTTCVIASRPGVRLLKERLVKIELVLLSQD